jgi:hypothetical protein
MEFLSFYALLKEFKAAYIDKCFNSLNTTMSDMFISNEIDILRTEITELKKITYFIKDSLQERNENIGINSNINSPKKNETEEIAVDQLNQIYNDNESDEIVDDEVIQLNSEFECFTEETLPNIILPEIQSTERDLENSINNEIEKKKNKSTIDIKSDLFELLLNNDLKKIDNLCEVILNSENCFSMTKQILESKLNINIQYNKLKSIDVKSHTYMAKFAIEAFIQDWDLNSSQLPINFPVMKFGDSIDKDVDTKTQMVIYDIIFTLIYVKCVRNKLSQKISDQQLNYSFLNLKTRLLFDPLILLHLSSLNPQILKNIIIERFKNYSEKGYLNSCNKDLKTNNCTDINVSDISREYDEYIKCFEITRYIKDIHTKGFENSNFKVPYNNVFSFEQIVNECIPCEISQHFKLRELIDITTNEDILKLFEVKKVKKTRILNAYTSHLHRFILEKDFVGDLPLNITESFNEYVVSIEFNSFDIHKFSLIDIGENIVKAVYVWNNLNEGERGKGNYTDFRFRIDSCMAKDLILSSLKNNDKPIEESDSNWSDYMCNNGIGITTGIGELTI